MSWGCARLNLVNCGVKMTKVFCDACGCEGASNPFHYRVHLGRPDERAVRNKKFKFRCAPLALGYVDRDDNFVSGRDVTADLCNKCYNEIVGAAVKILKLKQNKSKKQ